MAVEIMSDRHDERAVFICNTTDTVIETPLIEELTEGPFPLGAWDVAQRFLQWLDRDLREYEPNERYELYHKFRAVLPVDLVHEDALDWADLDDDLEPISW